LIEEGLWARKALGQHFLLDPSITNRIAMLAGDLVGRPVLEVGPGPGGLTRALLDAGAAPVIAIEKDPRFAAFVSDLAPAERLRVIEADALEIDEPAVLTGLGVQGPVPVISNLPYNVGTPLLVKWLKAGAWRGPMLLMFQLEVAQRIVARPGEPAYGRLAVLAQARCDASIVLKVPAGAFTPPPKVTSAVVRLVDRSAPFDDLDALERVTAAAFGQRRKMLRSSLSGLGVDQNAMFDASGAAPTARAEELSVRQFCLMAATWRALTA
jgi:16S rRNA (adenine1518-N6/adenine1519-N6)-dimethyltransferase